MTENAMREIQHFVNGTSVAGLVRLARRDRKIPCPVRFVMQPWSPPPTSDGRCQVKCTGQ